MHTHTQTNTHILYMRMYTCKHSQCHPEINVPVIASPLAIRISFFSLSLDWSFCLLHIHFSPFILFLLLLLLLLFPFLYFAIVISFFLASCMSSCSVLPFCVSARRAPSRLLLLYRFKFARCFVSTLEFASEFAYVKESRISENVGKHKTGILSAISNPCTKGAYILSIWHE